MDVIFRIARVGDVYTRHLSRCICVGVLTPFSKLVEVYALANFLQLELFGVELFRRNIGKTRPLQARPGEFYSTGFKRATKWRNTGGS